MENLSSLTNKSHLNLSNAEPDINEGTFRILFYIIGSITIIGVPSNLFVILVFQRIYRNSPTTINLIIISTTISDFMLITLAGPVHTFMYFKRQWTLGYYGCQFYGFWVHTVSVASLSHLTVMSVERYLIIKSRKKVETRPFRYQILFVIFAWGYAIFWAVLPFFGWSAYVKEGLHTGCAPEWVSRKAIDVSYNIVLIVTEFILPLAIILWAYCKLLDKIKEHTRSMAQSQNSEVAIKRGEVVVRSTMRMVILMVVAFVFSWLPYSGICVWAMVVGKRDLPPLAAAVPALFAKSSVIWNPLIYGTKHVAFRNEIHDMFRRLRGKSASGVQPEKENTNTVETTREQ